MKLLIPPTERVSHLFDHDPTRLLWQPRLLAWLASWASRNLLRGVYKGCQGVWSGSHWCRPGRTWTGGGILALVYPPMETGRLAASKVSHSSLVPGSGAQGLGLRRLLVPPRQANLMVPLCWSAGGIHPVHLPKGGLWMLTGSRLRFLETSAPLGCRTWCRGCWMLYRRKRIARRKT